MVCYARPAGCLAAILIVTWLAFSGTVSHFFGTAAVLVAVLTATAGAAVAAALAFAAVMSTRRRRAAAGGCAGCRFRCQHAMIPSAPPASRFWLVTTAHRRGPQPGAEGWPGGVPARSVPILLPVPTARSAAYGGGGAAPRWPDRPLLGHAGRERAGSPA